MGDTRWLTYAELADRLGITGESARNLVRRRRWPRKPGNDGIQRIGVPAEYLDDRATPEPTMMMDIVAPIEPPPEPPIVATTEGDTIGALQAHIASLEARTAELRLDLDQAREERLAERGRGDRLTTELTELANRFAASTDDARARLEAVKISAASLQDDLRTKLAAAQGELTALRARPWWRRLAG